MRYVVTGAAGFIGSHLAEALGAAGHEVAGIDCFTDYYDLELKEENARGLDVRRLDLAEDELDFAGVDAVFHLAGQPGVRSFGDVFPSISAGTCSPRSGCSRRPPGTALASSSRRPRRSTAPPSATRRPRKPQPRPLSPYGITKLACEHLAGGLRAGVRPRRRRPPLLQRLRAAAAAGHGLHADRERARCGHGDSSCTATATSRGAGRTWRTSSRGRSSRRWSGARAPTTSAARSRRR